MAVRNNLHEKGNDMDALLLFKAMLLGKQVQATPMAPLPPLSDSEIADIVNNLWTPIEERGYVDEGGWQL